MELFVRATGARRALEVGTFTGYSALCIARGLPDDGTLLCCDVNEEWTAIGRRYWDEAGVGHKIDLRIGPAIETLRALPRDRAVRRRLRRRRQVGLRRRTSRRSCPASAPDGVIMVDNTIWSGRVLDATRPGRRTPWPSAPSTTPSPPTIACAASCCRSPTA